MDLYTLMPTFAADFCGKYSALQGYVTLLEQKCLFWLALCVTLDKYLYWHIFIILMQILLK